jgi:hypothetical protein
MSSANGVRNRRSPSIRTSGDLATEFDLCRRSLQESLTAASYSRVLPAIDRFERFLLNHTDHDSLEHVAAAEATAYFASRTSHGRMPERPTVHNRRTALRLLFRAGRDLGIVTGDPTLDVVVPRTASRAARPLTDAEVVRARDASLWSLTSRRFACVWALAETTARGAELPLITWRHANLETGTVSLPGGGSVLPRDGQLTEWGRDVLARALADVTDLDASVIYTGTDRVAAGWVSASAAISTILVRAGLAGKRDVRPGSVAAWAGARCMTATGDITVVARVLGVHSLDVAARIIGWDWHTVG